MKKTPDSNLGERVTLPTPEEIRAAHDRYLDRMSLEVMTDEEREEFKDNPSEIRMMTLIRTIINQHEGRTADGKEEVIPFRRKRPEERSPFENDMIKELRGSALEFLIPEVYRDEEVI